MDAKDTSSGPPEAGLTRTDRMRRLHKRVLSVEPELGPGLLFKVAYLGTHRYPLCDDEYRRRLGSKFTVETPAIFVQNPVESRVRIQVELRVIDACAPVITVLLQPGRGIWLPILPNHVIETHASPRVIARVAPCVAR